MQTRNLLITCRYKWNRKHVPFRKFSNSSSGTTQSIFLWNVHSKRTTLGREKPYHQLTPVILSNIHAIIPSCHDGYAFILLNDFVDMLWIRHENNGEQARSLVHSGMYTLSRMINKMQHNLNSPYFSHVVCVRYHWLCCWRNITCHYCTLIEVWLEKLALHAQIEQYRHYGYEDNAGAHMKRQIMGREGAVAVTDGKLDFGTWEQIFYG